MGKRAAKRGQLLLRLSITEDPGKIWRGYGDRGTGGSEEAPSRVLIGSGHMYRRRER